MALLIYFIINFLLFLISLFFSLVLLLCLCFALVSLDDKTEYLAKQISVLQTEKKQIEEEFGIQRAKMKELYIQKESKFLAPQLRRAGL